MASNTEQYISGVPPSQSEDQNQSKLGKLAKWHEDNQDAIRALANPLAFAILVALVWRVGNSKDEPAIYHLKTAVWFLIDLGIWKYAKKHETKAVMTAAVALMLLSMIPAFFQQSWSGLYDAVAGEEEEVLDPALKTVDDARKVALLEQQKALIEADTAMIRARTVDVARRAARTQEIKRCLFVKNEVVVTGLQVERGDIVTYSGNEDFFVPSRHKGTWHLIPKNTRTVHHVSGVGTLELKGGAKDGKATITVTPSHFQ